MDFKVTLNNQKLSTHQLQHNYEIICDLGEGTFGTVKLGKHIIDNR